MPQLTPLMPWPWLAALALAGLCFCADICIQIALDRRARPVLYVPLCPAPPPLTRRQRRRYVGRHHLALRPAEDHERLAEEDLWPVLSS